MPNEEKAASALMIVSPPTPNFGLYSTKVCPSLATPTENVHSFEVLELDLVSMSCLEKCCLEMFSFLIPRDAQLEYL